MKLYAFAALLALPFFGLAAGTAKADYYCCGRGEVDEAFQETHPFIVEGDAVIFGCDGYHCETAIRILGGTHIDAGCRNGWCQIRSLPLREAWVLESCLRPVGYGHHGHHGHHEVPYGHDDYDRGYAH